MDWARPRILVVHLDQASSQALMQVIENQLDIEDINAVGCDNSSRISACVHNFRPDIVVLNASGFEFSTILESLHHFSGFTQIMVCGLRNCNAEIVSVVQAGAAACETVDGSLDDLVAQIQALSHGETLCPPRIARILFHEVANNSGTKQTDKERVIARLTRRELQIICLVERGLSNKQIARELSIETQTVKNHVHNILEKLQLNSRLEAGRFARENGLLLEQNTIPTSNFRSQL